MERGADSSLQPYLPALTAMLHHLEAEQVVARLWSGDPTLWHPSAATQAGIRERLGWLDLPDAVDPTVSGWLRELWGGNYTDVVWIVVDAGSSARWWQSLAAGAAAGLRLILLDTVEPATVQEQLAGLDPARTAVVCAAIDATPEVEALCNVVIESLRLGESTHDLQFTALTIPGSSLDMWLRERFTFRLLAVPAGLTERFSALYPLGQTITALQMSSMEQLSAAALAMRELCRQETTLRDNPGVWLGAILGVLAQHGRDLLTLLAPPTLTPLAEWISTFVGGALSKHRRGFVPLVGEQFQSAPHSTADRIFVQLRTGNDLDATIDAQVVGLERAGQPVLRFTVGTHEAQVAQVVCWQVAVAVAGIILGINPFDEPDTVALRTALRRRLAEDAALEQCCDIYVDDPQLPQKVYQMIGANPRASFLALVLYLPATPGLDAQLGLLRQRLGQTGLGIMVVDPLRDPLFATQVLHAGRPHGLIIALSGGAGRRPPEMYHGLWQLSSIRSAIDERAWTSMHRPMLRVELGNDVVEGLARFSAALGI